MNLNALSASVKWKIELFKVTQLGRARALFPAEALGLIVLLYFTHYFV